MKCLLCLLIVLASPSPSPSPRLCPSTAGCSPPSMSSIVLCLLLSCFTFYLGFVHPLQDVALRQCLPLSCLLLSCSRWFPLSLLCRLAIFCLIVFLISSFSLVAILQRLVHLLSFILAIGPAHLLFCFSMLTTTTMMIILIAMMIILILIMIMMRRLIMIRGNKVMMTRRTSKSDNKNDTDDHNDDDDDDSNYPYSPPSPSSLPSPPSHHHRHHYSFYFLSLL